MRHGYKRLGLASLAVLFAVLAAQAVAQPTTANPPKPAADTSTQLDSLLSRGDALLDEGIFDRALVRYLEAEKLDPTDLRIKLRLAKTYLKLGNRAAGLAALGSIFTAKPELRDNADLTQLRVALEALPQSPGTPAAASPAAASAPAADPNLAERTTSVALAARAASLELAKLKDAKDELTQQSILDRAWQALRPALAEFDIDSLEAWKAAAIIALGRKDNDLAALAYEAILRIQPGAANDNDMLSVLAGLSQLGAKDRLAQTRQQRAAALALLPAARRGERAAVIALAKAHLEGTGLNSDLVPARALVKRLPVEERKAAMREVVQATVTATLAMAEANVEGINERIRSVASKRIARAKIGIASTPRKLGPRAEPNHEDLVRLAAIQSKARETHDQDEKDSILGEICEIQANLGDIAGAKATVRGIQFPMKKDFALGTIVTCQAELGDLAGARATTRDITDPGMIKYALDQITSIQAETQAKSGDIARSILTAKGVSITYRTYAMLGIVDILLED